MKETFEEWMKKNDTYFDNKCGMAATVLPDAPWRDWYDSEMSPKDCFESYANEWDDTGMMIDFLEDEEDESDDED